MAPGDLVVYVKDPYGLYGPLEVTEFTFRGWVWCDDRDGRRTGPFQPHELELAEGYYVTADATA